MKKSFLLLATALVAISFSNAQTKVEIGIAGDVYWQTDNDKVGMHERQFAVTNLYKDRFGTNNILFDATAENKDWKVAFSLANFGEGTGVGIEDANVGIRLCHELWLNGGIYANWDGDYTYNQWFTSTYLCRNLSMGTPTTRASLSYGFNEDISLEAGLMNSGFLNELEVDNRSKHFFAKFDYANLINEIGATLSFITGNVESAAKAYTRNQSEIWLNVTGNVTKRLECDLDVRYFMLGEANGEEAINATQAQVQARYHFNDKFALGAQFCYTTAEEWLGVKSGIDFSLVGQYNPTESVYVRLEAGMLSTGDYVPFLVGDEFSASRMGVALSMGFKLGLFEHEIK